MNKNPIFTVSQITNTLNHNLEQNFSNVFVSLFVTKSDPETEQPFLSKPIANADIPIPPIPIK